MSISQYESFAFNRDFYSLITIYDDEDVEEVRNNCKNIENVAVSLEYLPFLRFLPNLKKLILLPGPISKDGLRVLYEQKQLKSLCFDSQYVDSKKSGWDKIDLAMFPNLEAVSSPTLYNFKNIEQCNSLKTLSILDWPFYDLEILSQLKHLDTLSIAKGKLTSLVGIEKTSIKCLYLYHLRNLRDMTALSTCSETLTALRIEKCPKLCDFSFIQKLSKLQLFVIIGNQGVFENLDFIKDLPELSFFVTDFNILDGILDNLKQIPYSSVLINRRHYNLRDEDLPREAESKMGNESIPKWRRLND